MCPLMLGKLCSRKCVLSFTSFHAWLF